MSILSKAFTVYIISNLADVSITALTVGTGRAYEANPAVAFAIAKWGLDAGLLVSAILAGAITWAITRHFRRLPWALAIIHTIAVLFNLQAL